MYPILLHSDGARAITYCGAHGDPSPPYTGQLGGWGQLMCKRTWGAARSRDLSRDRAAQSRDNTWAERGGDPPRHRSCDTSFIGGELRVLGLVGPMPLLNSKYTRNTHLFSVHTLQAHIRPQGLFFAYSALDINFKGVHMKLKIVALQFPWNGLFLQKFLTFQS